LQDLLGTRDSARLVSAGTNNDVYIEAVHNGAAYNGVLVQFVNVAASGDQATAIYDSGTNTLTIDISPGVTRTNTIVDAINATAEFTARLDDKLDTHNNGSELVDPGVTAVTTGGSGEDLDLSSGFQILNGGTVHTLTFPDVQTVEDLLNALNTSSAHVLASINDRGSGVNIRSRLSGSDFAIGENGGTLARQLGVRSFTEETYLAELNYGRGVEAQGATDFTIVRRDGVELDIDVSSAQTIQDVLNLINNHPNNVGNAVTARLSQFGNGIELEDGNAAGTENLTVNRVAGSAVWDLGLIPTDQLQSVAAAPGVGQPQVLTGLDVNPLETVGIFNTLRRLADAIAAGDSPAIERATAQLDENFSDLVFTRAELGGKGRTLDTLNSRLDTENIELRAALSDEIDADIIQSISDIAARQANLEASLRLSAHAFQLSLLDFL
jgi:flagellar hook-associated protein 3 FlgL